MFAKAGFATTATNLRYGPNRQVRDNGIADLPPRKSTQSAADFILFGVAALFLIGLLITLL